MVHLLQITAVPSHDDIYMYIGKNLNGSHTKYSFLNYTTRRRYLGRVVCFVCRSGSAMILYRKLLCRGCSCLDVCKLDDYLADWAPEYFDRLRHSTATVTVRAPPMAVSISNSIGDFYSIVIRGYSLVVPEYNTKIARCPRIKFRLSCFYWGHR